MTCRWENVCASVLGVIVLDGAHCRGPAGGKARHATGAGNHPEHEARSGQDLRTDCNQGLWDHDRRPGGLGGRRHPRRSERLHGRGRVGQRRLERDAQEPERQGLANRAESGRRQQLARRELQHLRQLPLSRAGLALGRLQRPRRHRAHAGRPLQAAGEQVEGELGRLRAGPFGRQRREEQRLLLRLQHLHVVLDRLPQRDRQQQPQPWDTSQSRRGPRPRFGLRPHRGRLRQQHLHRQQHHLRRRRRVHPRHGRLGQPRQCLRAQRRLLRP